MIDKDAVATAYADFLVGRNDDLLALMAEDFHDNVSGRTGTQIWHVVRGWIEQSWGDVDVETHLVAAEGDRVVVWMTMSGTHIGSAFPWMQGRPATGKRVAGPQVHVFRVTDTEIVEHWTVRDDLRVLEQIDAD